MTEDQDRWIRLERRLTRLEVLVGVMIVLNSLQAIASFLTP